MIEYNRYRQAQRQYDDEMPDDSQPEPYDLGFDCGLTGLDQRKNPYRPASMDYHDWKVGWEDGWKNRYNI